MPSRTGSSVFAAEWAIGDEPWPASLENAARFYHAFVDDGPAGLYRAYAASFRFKAPLISLLPFPIFLIAGPSHDAALSVNLVALALLGCGSGEMAGPADDEIQVHVGRIGLDARDRAVVILEESAGHRWLAIWIGDAEARSIGRGRALEQLRGIDADRLAFRSSRAERDELLVVLLGSARQVHQRSAVRDRVMRRTVGLRGQQTVLDQEGSAGDPPRSHVEDDSVELARASYNLAKSEYERARELAEEGILSRDQLDTSEKAFEQAIRDVTRASHKMFERFVYGRATAA